MWKCLECGRRFRTTNAAKRAIDNGCPKCGGVDIDIDATVDGRTTTTDFLLAAIQGMKLGAVERHNGHRVERVAAGFMIDERFAASRNELTACLSQSEPCKKPEPIEGLFENL